MSNLAKKGSKPLLILVLLAVSAIAVGAVLYDLFVSGPTKGIYTAETDVRGLDGKLIQAGNWDAYLAPVDSTTLVDLMYGGTGSDGAPSDPDNRLFAVTSAILVINEHSLVNEDLIMTIGVFETGTTIPYEGTWICTPVFAEFYLSDVNYRYIVGYRLPGQGDPFIPPTDNLDGTWTITYAQIADMMYDPDVLVQQLEPSGTGNSLVLGFVFPDLEAQSSAVEYSDVWPTPVDYTTNISVDVIVSLSVEET